jgi:hypothetical protein
MITWLSVRGSRNPTVLIWSIPTSSFDLGPVLKYRKVAIPPY